MTFSADRRAVIEIISAIGKQPPFKNMMGILPRLTAIDTTVVIAPEARGFEFLST
jgi:hypothetical protein